MDIPRYVIQDIRDDNTLRLLPLIEYYQRNGIEEDPETGVTLIHAVLNEDFRHHPHYDDIYPTIQLLLENPVQRSRLNTLETMPHEQPYLVHPLSNALHFHMDLVPMLVHYGADPRYRTILRQNRNMSNIDFVIEEIEDEINENLWQIQNGEEPRFDTLIQDFINLRSFVEAGYMTREQYENIFYESIIDLFTRIDVYDDPDFAALADRLVNTLGLDPRYYVGDGVYIRDLHLRFYQLANRQIDQELASLTRQQPLSRRSPYRVDDERLLNDLMRKFM